MGIPSVSIQRRTVAAECRPLEHLSKTILLGSYLWTGNEVFPLNI